MKVPVIIAKQCSAILVGFAQYALVCTCHAFEDKRIELYLPDGTVEQGVVRGVAADGSLVVSTVKGEQSFNGGEISLRRVS